MIVKMSSKGMVTIPEIVRKRLGISASGEIDFRITKNGVYIEPVPDGIDITEIKGALRSSKRASDIDNTDIRGGGGDLRFFIAVFKAPSGSSELFSASTDLDRSLPAVLSSSS